MHAVSETTSVAVCSALSCRMKRAQSAERDLGYKKPR